MVETRLKKKRWLRLPGLLMTIIAVGVLLSQGGPRGAAVSSPVEILAAIPAEVLAEILEEEKGKAPEELLEETVVPLAVSILPDAEKTAAPVMDPAWKQKEAAEKEKPWAGPVPLGDPVQDTYFDDAVFLGDSRTDGFRLYSGLEEGIYLCATGATVESVFTKPVETTWGELPLLDALTQQECEKIYIMLGVNELGWKGTDIFRNQSIKLLERLQEDHPEAEIVIQSILPVSKKEEARRGYVNNERIADYNAVWKELAEELNVAYMDVAEAVTGEDGCLPGELTYDGVHLNKKGCAIWLEYLRTHPVVDETTGEV